MNELEKKQISLKMRLRVCVYCTNDYFRVRAEFIFECDKIHKNKK